MPGFGDWQSGVREHRGDRVDPRLHAAAQLCLKMGTGISDREEIQEAGLLASAVVPIQRSRHGQQARAGLSGRPQRLKDVGLHPGSYVFKHGGRHVLLATREMMIQAGLREPCLRGEQSERSTVVSGGTEGPLEPLNHFVAGNCRPSRHGLPFVIYRTIGI